MKKILLICFALMIAASMCISAFAENGGFISSPTGKRAPVLLDAVNSSEDCVAELIVTAYSDRDSLSEEDRQRLEEAYEWVKETDNLISLTNSLIKIAKDQGIKTTDLAVSDLFDITSTDCDGHAQHGAFDITLEAESLENFVALLHFYDGEWHIVNGAEVKGNGNHLVFEENIFSPFAIVVNTAEPEEEKSTFGSMETIIIIIAVVVTINACAMIYYIISSKEKRK